VDRNFRESALSAGMLLSCMMRSTLVKNRSLLSRLSGILLTIAATVFSVVLRAIDQLRQPILHLREHRRHRWHVRQTGREPQRHRRGRILRRIEEQVRFTGHRVADHLGSKAGKHPADVGDLLDSLDVHPERVEAIEKHLEVDLDEVAARVHPHIRDLPDMHPPVPYRAGDVQTADVVDV
jgi:hypothetical protein